MGKRNYGNGIVDRRYRRDGSPTGYRGDRPFRAYCHYREQQYSRCFATYKGAEDWKRDQDEQDRNRDNIGYFRRRELERLRQLKVRDLVYNYIDHHLRRQKDRDRTEDDLKGPTDILTLHAFCSNAGIATIPLAEIKKHHFVRYFEQRRSATFTGWQQEKQLTPRAVARERNIVQRAFQVAIDENFFEVCHMLDNPVRGIKIEGSMYSRTRTIMDGEEEKLVAAFEDCQGLNKYYAPLAMYLAWDTGMRQQEIVNLRWSDFDFERRRITIRKSKTDRRLSEKGIKPGRIIALPCDAMLALSELWHHLNDEGCLPGWAREITLNVYSRKFCEKFLEVRC
jgi:integrase